MNRREFLLAAAALSALPVRAFAHHGWRSFDTRRPLYLEGTVKTVIWSDPHAELVLAVPPDLRVPPDLAARVIPVQQSADKAQELLRRATPPRRKDREWVIELPSPSQMSQWGIAPLRQLEKVAMIGYTFPAEQGSPTFRVAMLLIDDKAYPLRSFPA